jgi:hypothetical protein
MSPGSPPDSAGRLDEAAIASARSEQARVAAVNAAQAVYRLVKASMLHSENNEAVASLLRYTQESISDLCQKSGATSVSLLFSGDTVFVNGQMLRASRQGYSACTELGAMLDRGGVSEVNFPSAASENDIAAFARSVVNSERDHANPGQLLHASCGGIRLRRINAQAVDTAAMAQESVRDRIVRAYASAIVVVRELFDKLRMGDLRLPQRVKRVAQRLITHADEDVRMLVALVGARAADSDAATIAVNSAILSIAMGRQLTRDRSLLTALSMTALLHDVGKIRLVGIANPQAPVMAPSDRSLNDDELDQLPASAVVMLTALGRIHPPSITRVVIAYESLWASRIACLGPHYGGKRPPTMLSRILYTARSFAQILAPAPNEAPVTIDDAIQQLQASARDANDRTDIKLLLGALGFFPPGTLVELNTGEQAVVLGMPVLPVDFARPPVRVLYDASARRLESPMDLDLAVMDPDLPRRCIRRAVDADEQQLKVMREYVIAASRKNAASAARQAAAPIEASRNNPVEPPVVSNDEPAVDIEVDLSPSTQPPASACAPDPPPPTSRSRPKRQPPPASPATNPDAPPTVIRNMLIFPATREADIGPQSVSRHPGYEPETPPPIERGSPDARSFGEELIHTARPAPSSSAHQPRSVRPAAARIIARTLSRPDMSAVRPPHDAPSERATNPLEILEAWAQEGAVELSEPWTDDELREASRPPAPSRPTGRGAPATPRPSKDVNSMLAAYLQGQESSKPPAPPRAEPPDEQQPEPSIHDGPTRAVRWSATEAVLAELEAARQEGDAAARQPPPSRGRRGR